MKKWLKRIGLVVAALILLPLMTLFALGLRPGAGHLQASAEIQASPETLWAWIDDGDRLKQWVSWTEKVTPWSPQAGVGAKRALTMRDENNGGMLMTIDTACTEYMPPKTLSVHMTTAGEFDGQQTYRLTGLGSGRTRIEVSSKYHFSNPMIQLLEPLVTPSARKKLEGDIARLKMLAETSAELR